MMKINITIVHILSVLMIIGSLTNCSVSNKTLIKFIGKQMDRRHETYALSQDRNSITVITVGTGTPFAATRSFAGTGILVNGHFFMFDAGPGTVQQMELQALPLVNLEAVFLTHLHSDHYMDLPNMVNRSWTLGRNTELNVYGPTGVEAIMKGLDQFSQIENEFRVDHHGTELMDIEKATATPNECSLAPGEKQVVYNKDGITITAFAVNHDPVQPALGYVIEYKGKKVVLSGDTKKNDMVLKMAQNADILVHEVMLKSFVKVLALVSKNKGLEREAKIFNDIQEYHTSPAEVAELAQKAGVKKLVLSHLAPSPENKVLTNMYKAQMKAYTGPLYFAEDGDRFTILTATK